MIGGREEFGASVVDRITSRVEVTDEGCWEWRGAKKTGGYGVINVGGRARRVHRIVAAAVGMEVDGAEVCHRCDNPPCCNPAHLFTGSHRDNMTDMARKGRHKGTRGLRIKRRTHWAQDPERMRRHVETRNQARGERIAKAKLNDRLVAALRFAKQGGLVVNNALLCRSLKISAVAYYNMLNGKTWKHVGGLDA